MNFLHCYEAVKQRSRFVKSLEFNCLEFTEYNSMFPLPCSPVELYIQMADAERALFSGECSVSLGV